MSQNYDRRGRENRLVIFVFVVRIVTLDIVFLDELLVRLLLSLLDGGGLVGLSGKFLLSGDLLKSKD
jgi:hypothetical protein